MQLVNEALLDPEIVDELIRTRRCEDGARVLARRKLLHLTQKQLAELTGLAVSVISRIESGVYTPRDDTKLAIACALAIEVHDLWVPYPIAEARRRAEAVAA